MENIGKDGIANMENSVLKKDNSKKMVSVK